MQIALDSARGLEYIHEHTVPVYIHRDIKPANILIDKNFRGKVNCVFKILNYGIRQIVQNPLTISMLTGCRFWIGKID